MEVSALALALFALIATVAAAFYAAARGHRALKRVEEDLARARAGMESVAAGLTEVCGTLAGIERYVVNRMVAEANHSPDDVLQLTDADRSPKAGAERAD